MKRLGNQKGLTLVEVLIALAVFGVIVVSLFIALNVSHKTTHSVNRETTAESLTRSELEYIKSCDYDESGDPSYGLDPNIDLAGDPYNGRYSITVIAVPIDPVTYEPLPSGDDGIQKVTVQVYYDGDLVVATESYKVKR